MLSFQLVNIAHLILEPCVVSIIYIGVSSVLYMSGIFISHYRDTTAFADFPTIWKH